MSALDKLIEKKRQEQTRLERGIILLWSQSYEGLAYDAAEELAALRAENERLKAVEEAAKKLSQLLPVYEIELARDVWGNTNTRIISDAAKVLAAALRGEA